ncbi:hypothetical protein LZ30DRAFT_762890 [Colletotrichum cereale]|nr:hypothetical protein LZ30DRAFT_762890 [Colletotrichum cereale]
MAFLKDPPVLDRWDCHDFDGGPARRLNENMDFVPGYADRNHRFAFTWAMAFPVRRQPSYTAHEQPQCVASIMFNDHGPLQGCDPAGDLQTIVLVHQDVANVHPLDLAIMECSAPDLVSAPPGTPPESMSDFGLSSSGAPIACLYCPSLRRPGRADGVMMTFSVAVDQGPEYVVKLLDRPSNPDSACPQDLTQPTPFANSLAQQIAESTTLYHHDPLYQQPPAFETESSSLSGATFDVGRLASDETTPFPEFNPLPLLMAVITTGWPYGAQPVSAAHDDMDDDMAWPSPLSELYEMPDEADDWAVLMQQDTLFTGAFEMASFDCPAVETDYQATDYQTADFQTTNYQSADYQTTASPQDIFNDPAVQYDIEQSLQTAAFDFNGPLPDLSASGYLSGTDQLSSYFGSADTSPYEPALDFFPEDGPSSSFVFPASTDSSPPDTTATTTTAGTASPGSDAAGASTAPHAFPCPADGCAKSFRKEAQLKQHQRVHRKALVCDICRAQGRPEHKFAQVRDLERHLQARHRDVAERANVRSEVRRCPHPGCEHEGRRDNVSRHHKSKHGKELKWKRGVPHVVC